MVAAICGALMLVFPGLFLLFLLNFLPESIQSVQVPGRSGSYVISRVAAFKGEGFTLYQTYFYVFQREIAQSWRWNPGFDPPQVKLFLPEDPYRKTIYFYNVETGTIHMADE